MLTRNGLIVFNVWSEYSYGTTTLKNLSGNYISDSFTYEFSTYGKSLPLLSSCTLIAGSGDKPASADDYNLDSPIAELKYVNNMHFNTNNGTVPLDYIMMISTTIINTASTPQTIKEIGLRGYDVSNYFCLAREVLDEPIVLSPYDSISLFYKIKPSFNMTSNFIGVLGNLNGPYHVRIHDEPYFVMKDIEGKTYLKEYSSRSTGDYPLQGTSLRLGIGQHIEPSNYVYTMDFASGIKYECSKAVNHDYSKFLDYAVYYITVATNTTASDIVITEMGICKIFNGYTCLLTYQVLDEPVVIPPGESRVFELTI